MGEYADLMIEGGTCSLCGIYFIDDHEFPVLCEDCWNECSKKEREGYSKAFLDEIQNIGDRYEET